MALHAFLATIGPRNRTVVSDLTIRGWGGGRGTYKAMNFASLTILSTCTNLKSLYLDCCVGWVRQPKLLARQIYRDGHYFLEEFGAANGQQDAGIDVLRLRGWNFDKENQYGWHETSLPEPEEYKNKFQAELRKLLGC